MAALTEIEAGELRDYQPYHAARADLLARAGRSGEAVAAYDRAIELTTNQAEVRFLTRRRSQAAGDIPAEVDNHTHPGWTSPARPERGQSPPRAGRPATAGPCRF
jgi:hypothetical protein